MRSLVVANDVMTAFGRLEKPNMIQVIPQRLEFQEFQPQGVYRKRIQLRNISSLTHRLRIEPPRSSHCFKLVDQQLVKSQEPVFLAPGLEYILEVEFRAPKDTLLPAIDSQSHLVDDQQNQQLLSKERLAASEQPKEWKDEIVIYSDGFRQPLIIPVISRPAEARIEGPDEIDFGILKVNRGNGGATTMTAATGKKIPRKATISPGGGLNFDQEQGVSSRYFVLKNRGGKETSIEIAYDKTLPIRVTPTRVTLDAYRASTLANTGDNTSAQIKVDFLPVESGSFQTDLQVRSVQLLQKHMFPSMTSVSLARSDAANSPAALSSYWNEESSVLKKITLSAEVLDRQLQLRDVHKRSELNCNHLDFGTIYANECAEMKSRLVNRGNAAVRWVR